MYHYLLAVFALAAFCESAGTKSRVEQTLIFTKDDGEHCCDIVFRPHKTMMLARVFEKTSKDAESDQAVCINTVSAEKSPSEKGGYRFYIPSNVSKNRGRVYAFEIECSHPKDGTEKYHTESWAYDKRKGTFALLSSIEPTIWDSKVFVIAMGALSVILLIVVLAIGYRYCCKAKYAE